MQTTKVIKAAIDCLQAYSLAMIGKLIDPPEP